VGIVAVWLIVLIPVMVGASRLVEMPGIALGRRVMQLIIPSTRPPTREDRANEISRQAA
jgi:hypothetical protein